MSHTARVVVDWTPFALLAGQDGTVIGATGRSLRKNGRPVLETLAVRTATRETTLRAPRAPVAWEYVPLATASRTDFSQCPVCLSAGPLTGEHVPSQRLGGALLTSTCKLCNNIFGTKYEDNLLRFSEGRNTLRVRSPTFRGERAVEEVLFREDDEGARYMTTWNGSWPDWMDPLFQGAPGEFRVEQPCDCRPYVAALKNAYLAACIFIGAVPDAVSWPAGDLLRQQLVRWRDSTADHATMANNLRKIHVRYSAPPVPAGEVTLAVGRAGAQETAVIRLGMQLVVAWPLDAVRVERGQVTRPWPPQA